MRLSLRNTIEYNSENALKSRLSKSKNKQVSFNGLGQRTMIAISKALDNTPGLTSYSQKYDTERVMNYVRRKVGRSADILYNHIKKDRVIGANLINDGQNVQFRNKKPIRLLMDGLLYPMTKIPFYALYGFTNFLKRFKSIKQSSLMRKFERSSFYRVTHSYLKKDDKLNALQGLMEFGDVKNVMGAKTRAKAFLQSTAKTFDSKYGNYNGVNERALTRIVTGFIPAFFLANDAHNLSILCNDNKKEAEKEKKLRFRQESGRVLSNAYIQLITLGALSKFINKSKTWFVGVTVATVLLTEVYSRLRIGKKIHFISPEEAKLINKKEQEQNKNQLKSPNSIQNNETVIRHDVPVIPLNVSLNSVMQFIDRPENKAKKQNMTFGNNENKNINKSEQSRSIITPSMLAKIVGGIILAGFAVKGIKKLPFGKGHVSDIFDAVSSTYNKFYKKITMTKNHFAKKDMDMVMEKMKKCGFGTVADSYKAVMQDHQRFLAIPKHITPEFLEVVKQTGNENLIKKMALLTSKKGEKKLLDMLKKEQIDHNFKVFLRYLDSKKQVALVDSIKEINGKDGNINYPKLHKLFAKSENEPYREIFENLFAVDLHDLKKGFYHDVKKTMEKSGFSDAWSKLQKDVAADIESKDYYDLGTKKIPIVKDAVDFCIEPFKFVWGFVTFPYKGIMKIANALKVKPRTASSDVDAVAKALATLKKKASLSDTAFTNMFDEKIVKGFNTTTMSKLANSELSALAKTASTAATMTFLITDNYNMVMVKSNGENQQEASQKGKERFVQEMSRFFWQQMFINLFNNTFSHTYNASLLGASAVNTASTTIGEICTRKAVGLPIGASSKKEIEELERENFKGNGLKSKFLRFMSKLTGKQILSERETKK